jgi:hypothetical protein
VYTSVEDGVQYLNLLVATPFSAFFPLTGEPGGDDAPNWSPFGDEVLFSSTRGGNADIYAISPYGAGLPEPPNLEREPPLAPGEMRKLTTDPGADLYPDREPVDGACAGVEPNPPIPLTPSRPSHPGGDGGAGAGGGSGGNQGSGETVQPSGQGSESRNGRPKLAASLASVAVTGRGRRRTIVVRVRVNVRASVRVRLFRGRREIASRLWRVAAGAPRLRLRVPVSAKPGAYRLRLTVRDASGHVRHLGRTVRLRR